MSLDLKKLRARLAAAQTKGSGGGGQWFKPEKGDQTIRVVPTEDGDPFKDFFFHYNVGKNPGFLCPKRNYGEDCPICEFASKLWKEDTEDSRKMAKDLFARQRFFAAVLVRGQEDQKVRVWGFGKNVYETLIKYCLNPEYGDITDLETGTDLDLNYETPPGANFPKTTLQPKRKSTKLCNNLTKSECQDLLKSVPVFEDLMERKTTEECKIMLTEWLSEEPDTSEDTNNNGSGKRKYEGAVDLSSSEKDGSEENPIDKEFDDLLK